MMDANLVNAPSGVPPIVLLVEDDADSRDLYETALEFAGLWVAQTADPADALEYAIDLRPDSVVMDIAIPTVSQGLALAKAFRETPKTADMPLVAVTGLDPVKLRAGIGLFTTVFHKPVRLEQFVRRVRWLSARSAVLRERSERARARISPLIAKSQAVLAHSHRVSQELSEGLNATANPSVNTSTVRTCPRCRTTLLFSERRLLDGTTFDYYSPCRNGCGLFCYDHSRRKIITLVG